MIGIDITRGRCSENFERPGRVRGGKALPFKAALPDENHVFMPSRRMIVHHRSKAASRRREQKRGMAFLSPQSPGSCKAAQSPDYVQQPGGRQTVHFARSFDEAGWPV